MKPVIVLTTVGENYDARALAAALVERRLAACVNIAPNIFSVYRWSGKVASEYEQLLVIKADARNLEALKEAIVDRHPYQVPEFLVIPVETVPGPYAEWLEASLSGAPPEGR